MISDSAAWRNIWLGRATGNTRVDEVVEHSARPLRRKLIRIADHDQLEVARHLPHYRRRERLVEHRSLAQHERVLSIKHPALPDAASSSDRMPISRWMVLASHRRRWP